MFGNREKEKEVPGSRVVADAPIPIQGPLKDASDQCMVIGQNCDDLDSTFSASVCFRALQRTKEIYAVADRPRTGTSMNHQNWRAAFTVSFSHEGKFFPLKKP